MPIYCAHLVRLALLACCASALSCSPQARREAAEMRLILVKLRDEQKGEADAIRGFGRNRCFDKETAVRTVKSLSRFSEATENLKLVRKYPKMTCHTASPFTSVFVFYDENGRIADFAIGGQ